MGEIRKIITVAAGLLLLTSAPLAPGAGAGWTNNYDAARQQAKKEGKDLLLDFTGSDWCIYCIKLDKEVFKQAAFKKEAPKHFVLVKLDFPHEKSNLSRETTDQNNRLRDQYEVRGYPTILLADADGRAYAETSYQEGGAEKYLKRLIEFRDNKKKADALLVKANAPGVKGLEKAKLLDRFLEVTPPDMVKKNHQNRIDEIIRLDGKNEAGLKAKYELKKELVEVDKLQNDRRYKDALARLDQLLERRKPTGAAAQDVYELKAIMHSYLRDSAGLRASLEAAVKAAPDTKKANEIKIFLEQQAADKEKK